MLKLRPFAAAFAIALLVAGVLRRSGYHSYGLIDTAVLILFLIFVWWLISDFSGGKEPVLTDAKDGVDNSLAFRFGKFLNRVFRRGRSV
ncbi:MULTISPECIES: hypothetical protein [Mesorhizobium]|uniref:Uncharacterized protein n=1 Tax=Mesorhizobium shonense TaxID=1209948 RepID=A0ABV2HTH0_9HYPH|nr:hypothetical protein [Mesorhizobium sp.]RWA61205.1 MAG: hypothetical protein EOQ29_32140 [Mesorhizobium sp.]RWA78866.1 MAG: hypothetical protein EOQ30_27900 [Mesorhizobium sp.]RWB22677.1 MAG: hypothetical protein EOQ40_05545 [Mesorhizobium sp.]RWE03756.1 MAG: hypothetical protein EOS40_02825 [Mesorhizobium sp.]TIS52039.1 MAG: hypothetical protein E5W96_01745 [Mesorhizobium sp.]